MPNLEQHAFFGFFQHHASVNICCLRVSSDSRSMLCWREASYSLCSSLLPSYMHCSLLLSIMWLLVIWGWVITRHSCWLFSCITVCCVFLDHSSHWCCFHCALSKSYVNQTILYRDVSPTQWVKFSKVSKSFTSNASTCGDPTCPPSTWSWKAFCAAFY